MSLCVTKTGKLKKENVKDCWPRNKLPFIKILNWS